MIGETFQLVIVCSGLPPQSFDREKDVAALPIPVQPGDSGVEQMTRSVSRGVAMIGLFIRADVESERLDPPVRGLAQHHFAALS